MRIGNYQTDRSDSIFQFPPLSYKDVTLGAALAAGGRDSATTCGTYMLVPQCNIYRDPKIYSTIFICPPICWQDWLKGIIYHFLCCPIQREVAWREGQRYSIWILFYSGPSNLILMQKSRSGNFLEISAVALSFPSGAKGSSFTVPNITRIPFLSCSSKHQNRDGV